VIRHPFDRFVSAYDYLTNQTPDDPYWLEDKQERDAICDTSIEELARWPTDKLHHSEHFVPQMAFLSGLSGHIEVTDVVRFEELEAGWAEFASEMRLPTVLPRENASDPEKRSVLDDSTKDVLREVYAMDFELLNYE
jgi:hypothetical protein